MSRGVWNNASFSFKSLTVDNFIFRLVYRWTVVILLAFFLVITCKLAFGDSFACVIVSGDVPQSYLNTRCYSELFSSGSDQTRNDDVMYRSSDPSRSEMSRRYPAFYPWVNLTFLIQAFIFYMPHLFWKTYEGEFIGKLTTGLQAAGSKEQKRSLEIAYLAKFFLYTRGKHVVYTAVYICLEICNFVIVISQTVWLIRFFNVTSIPDYVGMDLSTWSSYRNYYFPSSGKCYVSMLSSTGRHMSVSAQCALPLNHLYMKMFLFLRGWYIFLILLTSLVLIYRMVLVMPTVRINILRVLAPMLPKSSIQTLCHELSYGDWFFLLAFRKLLFSTDFSKLLQKIVIMSETKVQNGHRDDDERSSTYEDSHKDLDISASSV